MPTIKQLVKTLLEQKINESKPKPQGKKIAIFSVLSGLVGAAAALLTTKKTGKENREILKKESDKLKSSSQTHLKELSEKSKEIGDKLSKEITEKSKAIQDSIKEQLKEINDKMKESQSSHKKSTTTEDKVVDVIENTTDSKPDKKGSVKKESK